MVLTDQTSNFEMLLAESTDICKHRKNIQTPMAETYKYKTNLLLQ